MIWFLIIGCAICAVTDAKERIIPNIVTFPLFFLGWLYSWKAGMLKESFLFFFILSLIGIVGFLLGGVGGGDVKMMADIGVWLGGFSVFVLTGAALAGTLWSFLRLARRKALARRLRIFLKRLYFLPSQGISAFKIDSEVAEKDPSAVPFGTFMGCAVILSFIIIL